MALVKFLKFSTADDGLPRTNEASDELSLAKLTLSGVGGVAIDAGNQLISNVNTPSASSDAATKGYVDTQVALAVNNNTWKFPVRAVATSNITLSGTQTIDGVSLIANDRVLVAGQSTASANGIYVVAAGSWSRSTDADANAEVVAGLAVMVTEGTIYGDTAWELTTDDPIVVGTTALAFAQFNGTNSLVAGAGLIKTGLQIDVELDTAANAQGAGADGGSSGLEFDVTGVGGKLRAAVHATAGLQRTASGLGILLDNTPNTLSTSGSGLKVTGVPLQFLINGSATSTNVTAANLGTLTAGPSSLADSLHYHSQTGVIWDAGANLTKGMPVYVSANDEVSPGDASAIATSRIVGLAAAAATSGNPVLVVSSGVLTGVLTGATAGTRYYLGATGALEVYGNLSTINGGDVEVVIVGIAKNATDLDVSIEPIGRRIF